MEEVEDKAVHVQEEDKVVPEGGGEESETSTRGRRKRRRRRRYRPYKVVSDAFISGLKQADRDQTEVLK